MFGTSSTLRFPQTRTCATLLLSSWLGVAACTGTLSERSVDGTGTPPDNGSPNQPGEGPDDPDPQAPAPNTPPEAPFGYASVGERCVDGATRLWVVLSTSPVDCDRHADFGVPDSPEFVRLPLPDDPSGPIAVDAAHCRAGAGCVDREFTVNAETFEAGNRLAGRWSTSVDGVAVEGSLNATWCDYDASVPPPEGQTPARSIRVSSILVNQGVAVSHMVDGQVLDGAERNAPIVAGRDALFQVGMELDPGFSPRTLIARITLDNGFAQEARQRVEAASDPNDPGSFFNIRIPSENITEDTAYRAGLFEVESCGDAPGEVTAPAFPVDGLQSLDAESLPGPLQVVLVPVRWNADGSGRVPNLDDAAVRDFQEKLYALYPVNGVSMSVRNQPLEYFDSVSPGGNGWSQLLSECLALRDEDNVPDNYYYYCLLQPTERSGQFCNGGCVSGIGPVPGANDTYRRASIGLRYNDGSGTFLHELGHTMGRPHAPCGGAAGADRNYPYNDARIGVFGYDLVEEEFREPDNRDFMSYCNPNWISDYNYRNIFERLKVVYGQGTVSAFSTFGPVTYRAMVVDADLSLSWGRSVQLERTPTGEPTVAEFLDAAGQPVAQGAAWYQAVTHVPGGIILIEDPAVAPAAVRVPGFGKLTY